MKRKPAAHPAPGPAGLVLVLVAAGPGADPAVDEQEPPLSPPQKKARHAADVSK